MADCRLQLSKFLANVKPSRYSNPRPADSEDTILLERKLDLLKMLLKNKAPISPFSGNQNNFFKIAVNYRLLALVSITGHVSGTWNNQAAFNSRDFQFQFLTIDLQQCLLFIYLGAKHRGSFGASYPVALSSNPESRKYLGVKSSQFH